VLCPVSALFLAAFLAASSAPSTVPAPASAPVVQTFTGSHRGDLKMTVPAGWSAKVEGAAPPAPGTPSTIRLTDGSGSCEALVTIMPPPPGVRDFNSPQRLRQIVEMQGQRMLAESRETKLELQELKGAAGTGLFFALSDKTPTAGSFPFVTGGLMSVGDLLLNFTILSSDKDPPQRRAALEMLANATQAPVATTQRTTTQAVKPTAPSTNPVSAPATPATSNATTSPAALVWLSLPGHNWSVTFEPSAGSQLIEDHTSADNRSRRMLAVDVARGVNVSAYLEAAAQPGDARAAREFYLGRLQNSPMPMKDIRLWDAGESREFAVLQYVVPDLNQKHVNYYASRDGVWIDVHVAAVLDPNGAADPALDGVIRTIRFGNK
jgi:hypothetical protein